MAKFDLFDSNSWNIVPNQQAIQNKIIGTLGNKIGEIRELRDNLKIALDNHLAENDTAYNTALTLSEEDAKLLNVKINYPNTEVFKVIEACDTISLIWKENKEKRTAYIVLDNLKPLLKVVEPYLVKNSTWYNRINAKELISKTTQITVTGNSIWDAWMKDKARAVYWMDRYNEVREHDIDNGPESIDLDDFEDEFYETSEHKTS